MNLRHTTGPRRCLRMLTDATLDALRNREIPLASAARHLDYIGLPFAAQCRLLMPFARDGLLAPA